MQNLFIKDDETFEIQFWVATEKEGTIFCDLTKESLLESFVDIRDNLENYEINGYKAVFKKPSFGDSIGLYQEIFSVTDGTNLNFNPVLARYKKISSLIKSWNLREKEEKPTEEDIEQLHPLIANVIGIALDLETGSILQ
jgi:hypothetical protein